MPSAVFPSDDSFFRDGTNQGVAGCYVVTSEIGKL